MKNTSKVHLWSLDKKLTRPWIILFLLFILLHNADMFTNQIKLKLRAVNIIWFNSPLSLPSESFWTFLCWLHGVFPPAVPMIPILFLILECMIHTFLRWHCLVASSSSPLPHSIIAFLASHFLRSNFSHTQVTTSVSVDDHGLCCLCSGYLLVCVFCWNRCLITVESFWINQLTCDFVG